ncbi:unnamed protein product, partial [Phaeothamnion confervicola]
MSSDPSPEPRAAEQRGRPAFSLTNLSVKTKPSESVQSPADPTLSAPGTPQSERQRSLSLLSPTSITSTRKGRVENDEDEDSPRHWRVVSMPELNSSGSIRLASSAGGGASPPGSPARASARPRAAEDYDRRTINRSTGDRSGGDGGGGGGGSNDAYAVSRGEGSPTSRAVSAAATFSRSRSAMSAMTTTEDVHQRAFGGPVVISSMPSSRSRSSASAATTRAAAVAATNTPTTKGDANPREAALLEAARAGRLQEVTALVRQDGGCRIDCADSDGCTPLMLAARRGHADVIRFLLTPQRSGGGGADPMPVDRAQSTALHWACKRGHTDAVVALLAGGASPDPAVDKWGWRPLHWSSEGGHDAIVSALLRAGARPDRRTKTNRTALHLAALFGHAAAVAALLRRGADAAAADDA